MTVYHSNKVEEETVATTKQTMEDLHQQFDLCRGMMILLTSQPTPDGLAPPPPRYMEQDWYDKTGTVRLPRVKSIIHTQWKGKKQCVPSN